MISIYLVQDRDCSGSWRMCEMTPVVGEKDYLFSYFALLLLFFYFIYFFSGARGKFIWVICVAI